MKVIDFLKGAAKGKTRTAADLAAALTEAEAEKARLAAELATLADRRRDALIGGTDVELDAVEREQTACCRNLDRADAALAELRRLLEQAEAAEADAALAAMIARAEAASAHGRDLLKKYDLAAGEMQKLLVAMLAAHAAWRDAAVTLDGNGLHGRVASPTAGYSTRDDGKTWGSLGALVNAAALPAAGDPWGAPAWPLKDQRLRDALAELAAEKERNAA
jgi:hypothetical protein